MPTSPLAVRLSGRFIVQQVTPLIDRMTGTQGPATLMVVRTPKTGQGLANVLERR